MIQLIPLSELRIGNRVTRIVELEGEDHDFERVPCIINAECFAHTYNHPHFGEIKNDFEPIPLTPEWLERFGFIQKDNWFYKEGFMLGWITDDKHFQAEIRIAGAESGWKILDIKYVHQLQNLFFCLCGKELEIGLKEKE